MAEDLPLTELTAVSPVDGRYGSKTAELRPFFSECALMKYRTQVEVEYLIALADFAVLRTEHGTARCFRKIEDGLKAQLRDMYLNFDMSLAQRIKHHELRTNHDVKAVEYAIKERIQGTGLEDRMEFVHFGLTSYDINDSALYMMIRDGMETCYVPRLLELEQRLVDFAREYRDLPMLARTHGQPASPTTLGKEFVVFAHRLAKQIHTLQEFEYPGKLNCATGNYSALHAAFPDMDWLDFSKKFLQGLGLQPNLITTQIEPHDKVVEWSQQMIRIGNIIMDLDADMWRYISDDWLVQKPKREEVGSSTMPHKVNPIDFENSEGNAHMGNGMFNAFVARLQQSRLQRDLVDSTITRNVGSAVAYSLLAVTSATRGLGKISANEQKIRDALNEHPEILAEAYQTILRREGQEMPYERLKDLTRGKKVTLQDMLDFVDSLKVPEAVQDELVAISPSNYIGIAPELVDVGLREIKALIGVK